MRYGLCVTSKAEGWSKSTEEAKVLVETAMGSCRTERDDVEAAALKFVQQRNSTLTPKQRVEAAAGLVRTADERIRNLAYETVLNARTAPNASKTSE